MELSFITHYYLITLFLHVRQDGKLLFAVDNSIFGYLTSSLPVFFWVFLVMIFHATLSSLR